MNRIIILGVSADIGSNICRLFHNDGFSIIGTFRTDFDSRPELESLENIKLIQCDITRSSDIEKLKEFFSEIPYIESP